MSTPTDRRSARAPTTSSSRSPRPRMMPDFVVCPASLARDRTARLRAYDALGRTTRCRRATAAMLWFTTSGAAFPVDHEGGGARRPALEDVGTSRLFAHRDERQISHRSLQTHVVVRDAQASLDEVRLARIDRQTFGDASFRQPTTQSQRLVAV